MNSLPEWVECAKHKDKIVSLMTERHGVVTAFLNNSLDKENARKRVLEITVEIKDLYLGGCKC